MTMLERIARAICGVANGNPNDTMDWPDHLNLARAAVEAMREPTNAMMLAGDAAVDDCWSLEPGEGLDEPPAPAAWTAMIDAILSEKEQP